MSTLMRTPTAAWWIDARLNAIHLVSRELFSRANSHSSIILPRFSLVLKGQPAPAPCLTSNIGFVLQRNLAGTPWQVMIGLHIMLIALWSMGETARTQ
jgi:hypothetical protein